MKNAGQAFGDRNLKRVGKAGLRGKRSVRQVRRSYSRSPGRRRNRCDGAADHVKRRHSF